MAEIDKIAPLFSDANASAEDIVRVCSKMATIDLLAREKLGHMDEIPYLTRAFGLALVVDTMAQGYELDVSSLSVLLGIPRPTVHRWIKKLEKTGNLELVQKGNRKIVQVKRLDPKVVEFFDFMAMNFIAPDS